MRLRGARSRRPIGAWGRRSRSWYVRRYHEATRLTSQSVEVAEGVVVGYLVKPYSRVGVYVPRGRRGYPSTAVMTVAPAKAAGVDEVVVCTSLEGPTR
ncbi:hypothetical protein B6U99_05575 [Candidatus Geothermarchaeota archaeon ex4572_27]|nr:MAG: hypothetical protein B6U99_05575 [Candidatus Geothermarchaeota archaeon ex4572_27]